MPRSFIILLTVLALAVLGAIGGGTWLVLFRGRTDPETRAGRLIAAGDIRGAQIELRTMLRDRPDDAPLHLRMAELQFRLGDPVAAEKELKTARALGAESWIVTQQLGRAYAAQGRHADVLHETPAAGPTPEITARLLVLRSAAQLALKDVVAATASWSAAERASPGGPDVAVVGAQLALAASDPATALTRLDAALRRNPAQLDALMAKQRILLGQQDLSGAQELLDRAVAAAPWATGARLERANLLMASGRDGDARADVDAVLRLQPRNPAAAYVGAVLLMHAGRYAEAAQELQKLERFASVVPRVAYQQALAAGRLGLWNAAETFAQRYNRRAPDDAEGLLLLAQAELGVQRADLALDALRKIDGPARDDPRTLDLLGVAYTMLGRAEEASASFERAAALAPDNTLAAGRWAQVQSRNARAAALRDADRPDDAAAEAAIRKAIAAGALQDAGAALDGLRARTGDTERVGIMTGALALARVDLPGAEAAFAATAARFPESLNARLNRSSVLALQGRPADAAAVLSPILAADPSNLPTLLAYVRLKARQREFAPAIQALEAARRTSAAKPGLLAIQADLLTRTGEPAQAAALLRSAVGAGGAPMLRVALAEAQAAAGQEAEAKATLHELVDAASGGIEAVRAQAALLVRMHDADAPAALRDALRRFPGDGAFLGALVGEELRANGGEAALRLADELRRNPANMPAAASLRGEALLALRRDGEARDALRAEYEAAPTPQLLAPLVASAAKARDPDAAAAILNAWLTGHPDDAGALRMLADVELAAGRYEAAQGTLETIVGRGRADAVSLNNLAWVYFVRKDGRALATARRAFMLGPTPAIVDTLAWIMVQRGEAEAAVPLLRGAAMQQPDDPGIGYHLAAALSRAGQREEAVGILRRITARPAAFDDRPAAQALLASLAPGR